MISVQLNEQQVQQAQADLAFIANGYVRATVRAVNRTADFALSQTAKRVSEVITPAQKEIKKSLSVSKANYSNPSGKLTIEGSKIPLLAFTARQTQTGVTFQIFRSDAREKYRHAFIKTMRSGHQGVFERRLGANGKPVRRLPIDERFGPSVPTVAEKTPGVLDNVLDAAATRFQTEFAHQVDYLLQQQLGSD